MMNPFTSPCFMGLPKLFKLSKPSALLCLCVFAPSLALASPLEPMAASFELPTAEPASIELLEGHEKSASADKQVRQETLMTQPWAQSRPSIERRETTVLIPGESALELYVLVSLSIPDEALKAIAKDAAALGIPLLLRGLPVKRAPESTAQAKNTPKLDHAELTKRISLLVALGASVSVDPNRWRSVEQVLQRQQTSDPSSRVVPVPSLVLSLGALQVPEAQGHERPADSVVEPQVLEVFPGEVRPSYALAYATENARSVRLREAVQRFLAEKGLSDLSSPAAALLSAAQMTRKMADIPSEKALQ